jgi:predicted Zn-dependent protease
MFERFFGPVTGEEKQALAEVEVTLQEERHLGGLALQAFLDQLKQQGIRVVTRGRDVEYLRELVEAIRPLMTNSERYPTIDVYLVKSPQVEARAVPGGTLVFFEGMLESAGSEAALIGVVGHELAHLDRGHQLADLRRVKLAQETFANKPGNVSFERFFDVGTLLMRTWTRPFRPEDEAEADRDGARWAYTAGYDPREMATVFRRLQEQSKRRRIPLPAFLQSHPPPADRLQTVTAEYQRLQQQDAKGKLYIGRENLRTRTSRAQRKYDN